MNTAKQNTDEKNISKIQAKALGISKSPGIKFIIIGVITVLLLIPALLVWGLVEERSRYAVDVANSIAKGWGENQSINGPYLAVPYRVQVERIKPTQNGNIVEENEEIRTAIISPDNVSINSEIEVEERKKSIYSLPVYHMKSNLSGSFEELDLKRITEIGGEPLLENAYLVMGISDPAGFRSEVTAKINDAGNLKFKPGLKGLTSLGTTYLTGARRYTKPVAAGKSAGINLPINSLQAKSGFKFDIKMAINGSRNLSVVPNGKSTQISFNSNWPHPGFDGRFLPEKRDISDKGFSANWTIPNLARGIDAVTLSNALPQSSFIQVNFVEPLKFYQVVSRTLKYAIAFFALIFLAVFILELMGKKSIHWIQYILVGLAMVIFYVMLLAMAEHIGFDFAFLLSALATTLLISWYVGNALGQKNGSLIMGAILGITYTIIFLVLKEQEYALLAGSIIAFLAIAITMFTTRNIDWSNSGNHKEQQTS